MNKIIELKIAAGEVAASQTITGFNPEIKGIFIYKDLSSDFGKYNFGCNLTFKIDLIQDGIPNQLVIGSGTLRSDQPKIQLDCSQFNHCIITALEVTMTDCEPAECRLIVRQGGELINVNNPLQSFAEHINDPTNTKIVLSGKFGQGKTTFLNHFFEQQNDYEVFTVYPVNYSVATNEDIFKYIKADILVQLLGKDIEFDVSKMSYGQALQEFLLIEPKYVIANVIKAILKLNKGTSHVVGAFEKLEKIHDKIVEYQGGKTQDDEESARSYISTVFEEEGSIYDDNFYTQLIRQLLEKVKAQSSNKKTVLVIEDLDRMDPDHIFRILNVVSAHYDTYMHAADMTSHNKFGFDKIILVCDIDNIRNIFHHKYGEHTDFDGYFNKYFSSAPFRYDNNAMVQSTISDILFDQNNQLSHIQNVALVDLLKLLVVNNQLKLRELIKMKNYSFETFRVKFERANLYNEARSFNLYFNIIAYLKEHLGSSLANRIASLQIGYQNGRSFNEFCNYLIAAKAGREDTFKYHYKNQIYDVNVKSSWNCDYKKAIKYTVGNEEKFIDFTLEDFKELLIELC